MYQDNRVSLRWQTPISSLFTEYHVKYRTFGKAGPGSWSAPIAVARTATTFTLTDLPPGEQFEIQVDSVSHHVPSGKPIGVTQIIGKKSLYTCQPLFKSTLNHCRPTPCFPGNSHPST